MRKSFKIKNLIRNNRYTILSKGKEALCPPLEGGPKSLISRRGTQAKRAFIIRAILGGGWTSPLLHSWGSLKKYGARLMCASNEPTPSRISKFAGSLRNSALPLGEGQTKSGERSPLLHTGHPRKSNMPFYVIPQRERMRQAGIVTLRDLKRKLVRDDDLTGDVKSHSDLIK